MGSRENHTLTKALEFYAAGNHDGGALASAALNKTACADPRDVARVIELAAADLVRCGMDPLRAVSIAIRDAYKNTEEGRG